MIIADGSLVQVLIEQYKKIILSKVLVIKACHVSSKSIQLESRTNSEERIELKVD